MYQLKQMDRSSQPRERLLQEGAEGLSDQELLAILLRTGTRQNPVSVLASKILEELGDISRLRQFSLEELQQLKGIGPTKAIEFKAMIELGRRIKYYQEVKDHQILSSRDLAKQLMLDIGGNPQEHLLALYLNTQNKIIRRKTIFIGSVNRSIAEPREILHYAIKYMATSIIIAHNHPSGVVLPSTNDIHFTNGLKKSCEIVGIHLLDHIIVGGQDYYSFREEEADWILKN
ncbi:RadC family protein [Streptococcus sp. DD13]|uniref:RadC family protein n=1 Tax=Streptococcus sp. DD13 TaxID=1777881 RepID=UPI000797B8C4|nr:DNA repair protein RadC [Streptococcus sp. DD13]KXT78685.1 DNA repair protein RadC [Streptococcus sp. DD13]